MSCNPSNTPPAGAKPPGESIQSNLSREMSPAASDEDIAAVAAGIRSLAFDLYGQLRTRDGNLFFSPYSISAALAMAYAGARGETEQQMAKILHFDLPRDRFHPAMNALDLRFVPAAAPENSERQPFRLRIVSRLWGQTGYKFLPSHLELVARNYGAGVSLLDLANRPADSVEAINQWVNRATEGRIPGIISAHDSSKHSRLIITNAIYFKARWLEEFARHATKDRPFTLLSGQEVPVSTMAILASFPYAEGEGWRAIELPYRGARGGNARREGAKALELSASMLIIVPDKGRFSEIEQGLSAADVSATIKKFKLQRLNLRLPRFSFDSELGLARTLESLGMGLPFSDAADFSGMDGTDDLFIRDVLHRAFVKVDEEGTEAAAATDVKEELKLEARDFDIDRPFIFAIRETTTDAIVFLGRVLDPRPAAD
jgi:serpin B